MSVVIKVGGWWDGWVVVGWVFWVVVGWVFFGGGLVVLGGDRCFWWWVGWKDGWFVVVGNIVWGFGLFFFKWIYLCVLFIHIYYPSLFYVSVFFCIF